MEALLKRIREKSIGVCVMGLGYVGLPTLAIIGSAGFHVTGVDVKNEVIERVGRGEDATGEPGLGDLLSSLLAGSKLTLTTDLSTAISKSGIVLICVQTPITVKNAPDLTFLKAAVAEVGRRLRRGTLVLVGSTVPPGTIENAVLPSLEGASRLKAGVDFWLAHCPERISPGDAIRTFRERARLVGGVNESSRILAAEFLKAIGIKMVLEGGLAAVELAKTSENTYRYLNIAFANELALIAEKLGIDVYEAIRLANSHERVNIHQPGAGVGGPCLRKDSYLLVAPANGAKLGAELIHTAHEVNESMPRHVVGLVTSNMKELGLELRGASVGVLGVAYRGGTNDTRNSPSENIIRGLLQSGARVLSYDPLSRETFGSTRKSSFKEIVDEVECVVVASDHAEFRRLTFPEHTSVRLVVDGRRVCNPEAIPSSIRYVAVGDLTHKSR